MAVATRVLPLSQIVDGAEAAHDKAAALAGGGLDVDQFSVLVVSSICFLTESRLKEPGVWLGGYSFRVVQKLRRDRRCAEYDERTVEGPVVVDIGVVLRPLVGIPAQVEQRAVHADL